MILKLLSVDIIHQFSTYIKELMKLNLFIETDRQQKIQLMPISKTKFLIKETDNKIVLFNFNENGKIESLIHTIYGRNTAYKKVD